MRITRGVISVLVPLIVTTAAHSAELVHNFNSPAFNGMGYSSHILTIKQLEDQQRDKNRSLAEAIKARADFAAANTPQARFIANIESRIYSQLAKQLTDSIFGNDGMPQCTSATAGTTCGSIPDLAGNTVAWKIGAANTPDAGMIIITITSLSSGNSTVIKVPSGSFYFGGEGGP